MLALVAVGAIEPLAGVAVQRTTLACPELPFRSSWADTPFVSPGFRSAGLCGYTLTRVHLPPRAFCSASFIRFWMLPSTSRSAVSTCVAVAARTVETSSPVAEVVMLTVPGRNPVAGSRRPAAVSVPLPRARAWKKASATPGVPVVRRHRDLVGDRLQRGVGAHLPAGDDLRGLRGRGRDLPELGGPEAHPLALGGRGAVRRRPVDAASGIGTVPPSGIEVANRPADVFSSPVPSVVTVSNSPPSSLPRPPSPRSRTPRRAAPTRRRSSRWPPGRSWRAPSPSPDRRRRTASARQW